MKIIALATASLVALALATGCATQTEDVDAPEETATQSEALRNTSGGVGTTKTCEDKYGDCYINCSVKGGPYQDGCFDSCDAAYNLCKSFGGGGAIGGGLIMY